MVDKSVEILDHASSDTMNVIVFDAEANGFLEEADKVWCIGTKIRGNGKERLFTPDQIQMALGYLHSADVIVGHNIKGYDFKLFKKLYNWEPLTHQIVIDTVVFSRMLQPKRFLPDNYTGNKPHSIEAWGCRLGHAKPEHEDWSKFSEDMGHRCMEDVRITLQVLEELEREAGNLSNYYEQLRSDKNPMVGAEGI